MVKRRPIPRQPAATAGSYLLSACGGSGSGGESAGFDSKGLGSMAKVGANASANSTVMPGAASIIDGYGDVWTLRQRRDLPQRLDGRQYVWRVAAIALVWRQDMALRHRRSVL